MFLVSSLAEPIDSLVIVLLHAFALIVTAAQQVQPKYVSCIIQINADDSWVSDSPYIHAFDELDKVHHQMEEDSLIQALKQIEYRLITKTENPLPNGKKLVQIDFIKKEKFR